MNPPGYKSTMSLEELQKAAHAARILANDFEKVCGSDSIGFARWTKIAEEWERLVKVYRPPMPKEPPTTQALSEPWKRYLAANLKRRP